jgi:type IV pilus assembly protein PilA
MRIRWLSKGFTLIELLIVVALVAVVAAIAVPNFTTGRTRAKVSGTKAIQQKLFVALEAFHADHQWYPMDGLDAGGYSNFALDGMFQARYTTPPWDYAANFGTMATSWPEWSDAWTINGHIELTTPVAYIAEIPEDSFSINAQDPFFPGQMIYCDWCDYMSAGINEGPIPNPRGSDGAFTIDGHIDPAWYLQSFGPDGYKNDDLWEQGVPAYTPYDPTNGACSYGDIFKAGP